MCWCRWGRLCPSPPPLSVSSRHIYRHLISTPPLSCLSGVWSLRPTSHPYNPHSTAPPPPTHQAVARLLILLWEHELDLLRHAHGVATDEELVAQLLEYTTRTLQVCRAVDKSLRQSLSSLID